MRQSNTISSLGEGRFDAEPAILSHGNSKTKLCWNNDSQVWMGKTNFSIRYRDLDKLDGPYFPTGTWCYFSKGLVFGLGKGAYSWFPQAILDAKTAYESGLILQENLSAIYWSWDLDSIFELAVVWYNFDHDGYIDPTIQVDSSSPNRNLGVSLQCIPTIRKLVSTGWQNSPIDTPQFPSLAPHFYTRHVSGPSSGGQFIEQILSTWRWVGIP